MGRTTPHSVLTFRLVLTLCICPLLISGLDRKISPEDLRRSLERMQAESPQHYIDGPGAVTAIIECVEKLCDEFTKQLVIREVVMRNSFKKFDEACTSYNDEKLLLESPNPFAFEDQPWNDNYVKWQNKVLDSGKIYCDPFKNLFCSRENKCGCGPGKKFKFGATPDPPIIFVGRPLFTADTCIFPLGGQCTAKRNSIPDPKRAFFFNPLYNPVVGTRSIRPEEIFCENNITCSSDFRDYFMGSICLNDDLDKKLNNVKKYFNEDVKGLKSGESCNLDGHNQLYKSEALDSEKFNVRLKALESFQASGGGVCDLRSFHTCGKTGKCECLEPTVLKGDECTLPVTLRTCENNPIVKAMIMENSFVLEAQRRLAKEIEKLSMGGCGVKFECHILVFQSPDISLHTAILEMFCVCRGFFTGENCDQILTLFLPFTRPSSLPTDVKGSGEKLKIFTDFNKEAVKLQEKLKLKSGEKCDFYKELEVRRVIRRIDSLNDPNTEMRKSDYEILTKAISNLAQSGQQYCLRNLDPQRNSLIEHSPYNQPIECEYCSRVCQTPLSAPESYEQMIASLRSILDTHFSTLGCGEPCSKNIVPEIVDIIGGLQPRYNVELFEDYLYDKTTFCVRSMDVAAQIKCETQSDGVNRKCVCRGANCTSVCSTLKVTTGPTNHGVWRLAMNGGTGWFLLFQFLTPFTLLIYSR